MKIITYIQEKIELFLEIRQAKKRQAYLNKIKKGLNNTTFSLIANNCNGCVLLHELGLKFNSQFVNLSISSEDYIKYLKRFDYYNNCNLVFLQDTDKKYPVGKVDDITIYFMHYKTAEEAQRKWEERKKRINKDNLFILFTEQVGCTKEHLIEFDNLPFENKVVFTCNKYDDIKSAVYIKKYKDNPAGVYLFFDYIKKFSFKRNYDVFDWIKWFNGERDLKTLNKDKL